MRHLVRNRRVSSRFHAIPFGAETIRTQSGCMECVFHLSIRCFFRHLPLDRLEHRSVSGPIGAPVCAERAPTPGDCAKE